MLRNNAYYRKAYVLLEFAKLSYSREDSAQASVLRNNAYSRKASARMCRDIMPTLVRLTLTL